MQDDQNLLQGHQQAEQQTKSQKAQKKITLLYAWGRNQDGELAVSNSKTISLPTAPRNFKGYARQIATARAHTAVVNHVGQIYVTGSNRFGILGSQSTANNFRQFHIQQHMRNYQVKQVACGDFHTLALTVDGKIFSWGGTLWDKTAHKGAGIHQIQKLAKQNIIEIGCGDVHSVALSSKGNVYSWGGGGQNKNKGQLGHSNKKDLPHPQLIKFLNDKHVVKIACGEYHTMVMTSEDQIYSFGEGSYGQLGTGGKDDSATPKKININYSLQLQQYFRADITEKTKIVQIALGGHHSLFLTNKGHLYVCGYGSQGQLGTGAGNTQNKYEPTLVKSMLGKRVIMIAAGTYHSLALTDRHDVYACGLNAKGQVGIGQKKFYTIWTHVSHLAGKNVGAIFAGGEHSWAAVDQTQPFIQDYQPPSPLKINIDEPTMIKHTHDDQSHISGNSVNELIGMITPRKLQLIITQVEYSHRFIHYVVKDGVKHVNKRMEEYISFVQQNQKNQMKFYKITEDTEMQDAKGKLMLPANPNGFTIMIVSCVQNADEYVYCDPPKTKIAIGDLLMMDSGMLMNQGKVPIHNRWFFKFNQMFDDIIQRVRFIELRPKQIQHV